MVRILLACLFLLFGTGAAHGAAPAWTVAEVHGRVTIADAEGARAARRGVALRPGTAVVTGPRARAVLVRGGEYAVLSPGSRFRLPAAHGSRGLVQWIADTGSALFRIERRAAPHFGVRTRYLAAVVKGTTFRVTATGAAVGVVDGAVGVSAAAGGPEQRIAKGQAALVSGDAPERVTVGRYNPEAGGEDTRDLRLLDSLRPADGAAGSAPAGFFAWGGRPSAASPGLLGLVLLVGAGAIALLLTRRRRAAAGAGADGAAGFAPDAPVARRDSLVVSPAPSWSPPVRQDPAPVSAAPVPAPAPVEAPVEAAADDPRRGAKRSRVLLAATVRADGAEHAVRLRDLSRTGAVVEGMTPPALGSTVRIEAERFAAAAEVLWVRDGRFGMRFDQPLDEKALFGRGKRPRGA